MQNISKSLSELQTERDALNIKILCEKFAKTDKPLPYIVAIVAFELQRGNVGSQIPRELRTKSFLWYQVRKFQGLHNREPNFLELLTLVA